MEDVCGGSKAGLVEQVDQGTGGGCEAGALGPYLGVLDAQLILYLLKGISFRLVRCKTLSYTCSSILGPYCSILPEHLS